MPCVFVSYTNSDLEADLKGKKESACYTYSASRHYYKNALQALAAVHCTWEKTQVNTRFSVIYS